MSVILSCYNGASLRSPKGLFSINATHLMPAPPLFPYVKNSPPAITSFYSHNYIKNSIIFLLKNVENNKLGRFDVFIILYKYAGVILFL